MSGLDDLRDEIIQVSAKLVDFDLVEYKGGNISVRVGDEILISRRGSNKAVPAREDIILTGLDCDDEGSLQASSALEIHREIYQLRTRRRSFTLTRRLSTPCRSSSMRSSRSMRTERFILASGCR